MSASFFTIPPASLVLGIRYPTHYDHTHHDPLVALAVLDNKYGSAFSFLADGTSDEGRANIRALQSALFRASAEATKRVVSGALTTRGHLDSTVRRLLTTELMARGLTAQYPGIEIAEEVHELHDVPEEMLRPYREALSHYCEQARMDQSQQRRASDDVSDSRGSRGSKWKWLAPSVPCEVNSNGLPSAPWKTRDSYY